MKKLMGYVFLVFFLSTVCMARDNFGGSFAGGLTGSLVGGALTNVGRRDGSRRDVEEIRRQQQQDKIDELRRQQEADKAERERRLLEEKILESKTQGSSMFYVLWGLVILLLVSIITLAFIVLRKR